MITSSPIEVSHPAPRPLFIDGPKGPLFAIHYAPAVERLSGEAVLYLPPFAEEMNRSRRMATLQGRALAAHGVGFLILDPYGTGDSAGDFAEATWDIWCEDAIAAMDWLVGKRYSRISLLGLRTGACLALDAASARTQDIGRVMLWQPVINGRIFLNQFLRVRTSAGLGGANGGDKESTKELRRRLREGETLEIAGYPLSPALADAIESLNIVEAGAAIDSPISWIQIALDSGAPVPEPIARAAAALSDHGRRVDVTMIEGEQFWAIEETTLVPALIAATSRLWSDGP